MQLKLGTMHLAPPSTHPPHRAHFPPLAMQHSCAGLLQVARPTWTRHWSFGVLADVNIPARIPDLPTLTACRFRVAVLGMGLYE